MPRQPHPPISRAKVVRLISRGNRLITATERAATVHIQHWHRQTVATRNANIAAQAQVEKARLDWNAACEDALSNGGV